MLKRSLNAVLRKSTSPNLFGQHPPFQKGANFGTSAGIAEMMLQSYAGILHLLPALPTEWPEGSVKGLKALGGFAFDINWKEGRLENATIYSEKGGDIRVL